MATRITKATKQAIQNAVDQIAVNQGCYFDPIAADHVCEFFERFLIHSKGEWAGQRFFLQDWQRKLLQRLFGWKRADGYRRFREAYIEIPKKSGKSAMCSGLALYLLLADGEAGAEVYSAAVDRTQAGIVFNESLNFVKASPELQQRIDPVDSQKRLVYESTRSYYQVLSSEHASAEGKNIHGLIFDELHAQPDSRLFDALRYGGAARRQPLLISITTAGYDRNSICYKQHDYAQKVEAGVVEDIAFFGCIYSCDESEWTTEAGWRKANPSLGTITTLDEFKAKFEQAREDVGLENTFKRYRLNIWTEQAVRYLQMDKWDENKTTIDLAELDGKECFGGLDLASTTDTNCFLLLFPHEEKFIALPFFWIPSDNARARERRDRVPYRQWAKSGLVKLTEGNETYYETIRRDIVALSERYAIRQINFDDWNATHLTQQLENDGLTLSKFSKSLKSYNEPTKELARLVRSGRLLHDGNQLLRSQAANLCVKIDPDENHKPVKSRDANRIDSMVALIMALQLAMFMPDQSSVYDTQGVTYF